MERAPKEGGFQTVKDRAIPLLRIFQPRSDKFGDFLEVEDAAEKGFHDPESRRSA